MKNIKHCYVSAYLDIGREQWNSQFKRSFEDYYKSFSPTIQMFDSMTPDELNDYEMILFLDELYVDFVIIPKHLPIRVIKINKEFMNTYSELWKRLPQETDVINSEFYKTLLSHRLHFPEHKYPQYTLLNHCKVDFINMALNLTDAVTLCWIDFGYFKLKQNIPKRPIDYNVLDDGKIHYTLINQLDVNDMDIMYTLYHAPERVGGFFFGGNRNALKKYQKLYWEIHLQFLELGLVDDDQHLALRCVIKNPDLFQLHILGGWHLALIYFQKKLSFNDVITH